uniref:Uncharacterized protein n=1 Tax=Anopheles maculatus TaxID=74869 RepID=A0A182SJH3_9DIPT
MSQMVQPVTDVYGFPFHDGTLLASAWSGLSCLWTDAFTSTLPWQESGTYLGALKCVRESCPEGRLLPINPLKISSLWRCDRCNLKMDNIKASKIQEIAGRMILNNAIKREASYIIDYLNDHIVKFLLPTNQFTVELKLQAIKKIQSDRPLAELREKEKYCIEILD